MKQLQVYLSMYELLNVNKTMYQLHGIDEFLKAANPFDLHHDQNISTQFINAYNDYFQDEPYNDINAYQFIISFLYGLNNENVLTAFKLCSEEQWLINQEMIIN